MSRFLLIALSIFLLGAFYFWQESRETDPKSEDRLLNPIKDPSFASSETKESSRSDLRSQLEAMITSTTCPQNLSSWVFGLKAQDFREAMKNQSGSNEELHWENYYYQDGTEEYVLHLTPKEGDSSAWLVKTFREDEEGPTLISQKTYQDFVSAKQFLEDARLTVIDVNSQLSWSRDDQVSIQAYLGESIINLKFLTPRLQISCTSAECTCQEIR